MFAECETRRCVNITIVNDAENEPVETFTVTLLRTPGLNSRIRLDPANEEITIVDEGMPTNVLVHIQQSN